MPSKSEGLPGSILINASKSSTTIKPRSKVEATGSNTIEGTMTLKRDSELPHLKLSLKTFTKSIYTSSM
jgi:hypothetical protein